MDRIARERERKRYAHITHANHMIHLLDPEPVQNVGHECLESHILHTSNHLGRLEVAVSTVTTTLAEIVDEVPMEWRVNNVET